jgi:hypothetical protein
MVSSSHAFWSDLFQRTLVLYDETLLRQAAARLIRPRNQWPVEELILRSVETINNPVVIDRRVKELELASRQALALIGHSRQPVWSLGNLIEMLMALGCPDGLQPLFALLDAGLLCPLLTPLDNPPAAAPPPSSRIRTFQQWLALPGPFGLYVFSPPQIAERAIGESLGLPDLSTPVETRIEPDVAGAPPSPKSPPVPLPDLKPRGIPQESDGLEWLLRLAVLWQQVNAAPLRRTQQGGFFKRDLERLQSDPLLMSPPAEKLADVPDLGFLLAAMAEQHGMLQDVEGELRVGPLPALWETGLWPTLEAVWTELWRLTAWNPLDGWRGGGGSSPSPGQPGNPFASAYLLTFLLLARLPADSWMRPGLIQDWLLHHHPYWSGDEIRPSLQQPWLETFLLGVAYHLRLVQTARAMDGAWLVRLTPLARWLLHLGEAPAPAPVYSQTLLIQPNLEIVAFRQGLSPGLILKLTRFATWKSLGAACTLQLEPETVYRALEMGQTFETLRMTLEQHGTRAVPTAVLDSLRTWSNKRDRITVYPSATLLEFATADDLTEALARGLPGVRIAETLAVVASEDDIDFKNFRLTGTRDYALPPERCVTLESDGVTLTVDLSRSDLLLETELPRFAEPINGSSGPTQRQYRLTPASLGSARSGGLQLATLETWFQQRCGQPLSAAARMLLIGSQLPPSKFQRLLILQVANTDLADGLLQWPATRGLIAARLGPTALVVSDEQMPQLRERLREAGLPAPE